MTLSYGPFISRKQAQAAGIKYYYTGKPCKNGHICAKSVYGQCHQCRKDMQKQYDKNKRYSLDPKAKARKRAKEAEWREAAKKQNPDFRKKYDQKYIDRIETETGVSISTHRANTNPQFKLHGNLNRRVALALKGQGIRKASKTTDLIGCSIAFAKAHLQAQFLPGMTWDNHGEWHIDHIRPCASFDLTDLEQQKQCFHYTNLQPLWAADNFAKSDNWVAA